MPVIRRHKDDNDAGNPRWRDDMRDDMEVPAGLVEDSRNPAGATTGGVPDAICAAAADTAG